MVVPTYGSAGADAKPECMKCVYMISNVGGNMDIVPISIHIWVDRAQCVGMGHRCRTTLLKCHKE